MQIIIILLSLQSIALGWAFGAVLLTLGMARKPKLHGPVLVVTKAGWVRKFWKRNTSVGHCIAVNKESRVNPVTIGHELTHVRQYEDLCALGCVLAAVSLGASSSPALAVILWATAGAPWILLNYVTAAIRYKHKGVSWMDAAYYRSEHERAAYAQHQKRIYL